MKVLLLDQLLPNYEHAFLREGLTAELGSGSVLEWPSSIYSAPELSPFPWMTVPRGETLSSDQVTERIRNDAIDLVIMAAPRDGAAAAFDLLAAKGTMPRLVLVDPEDGTNVRWDFIERFRPSVYFKVSTVAQPFETCSAEQRARCSSTRIVPFALATTSPNVAARAKDIDVAMMGGRHFRGLQPFYEKRLREEFPNAVLATGYTGYHEFIDVLARSKISVVLGGHGIEAIRTYESMSCPDTMVIRWDCGHIAPIPIVHGTHCATYATPDEMIGFVRYFLERDAERLQLARAGNELLRAHYTPRARAQHLLREAFA